MKPNCVVCLVQIFSFYDFFPPLLLLGIFWPRPLICNHVIKRLLCVPNSFMSVRVFVCRKNIALNCTSLLVSKVCWIKFYVRDWNNLSLCMFNNQNMIILSFPSANWCTIWLLNLLNRILHVYNIYVECNEACLINQHFIRYLTFQVVLWKR